MESKVNPQRPTEVDLDATVDEFQTNHLDETIYNESARQLSPNLASQERGIESSPAAAIEFFAWELERLSGRLSVSKNVQNVLGVSSSMMFETAEHFDQIVHPEDRDRRKCEIQRAFAEIGHPYRFEYRVINPVNHVITWLDDRGFATWNESEPGSFRLVVVTEDITLIKAADQAIRVNETRFRLLANTAPVMIWLSDPSQLCCWFNEKWLKFVGRTMEQEIGNGWTENVHPDDFDRCLKIYTTSFDVRQPFAMKYRLKRRDGEYRWILDNGVPDYGLDGRFDGYIGSCIDIHDLKQAEAALLEVDHKKNEFLALLAHEIRNPLAPIRNCLEILKVARNNGEAVEQARVMMDRHLTHVVRLVNDLLEASRISRGTIEIARDLVDLTQIVQQAIETSRPLIDSNRQKLTIFNPCKSIVLAGDSTRLVQAIANILNNAATFTHKGGQIQTSVEIQNSHAIVTIVDDGIGIPSEKLTEIFKLFGQVDSSSGKQIAGLGVGLTLAKRICELHGGSIEVQSEGRGRGSRFIMRLPIVSSS